MRLNGRLYGLATFTWLSASQVTSAESIGIHVAAACVSDDSEQMQVEEPLDTRATCQNCRPVLMVDETLVCFGIWTLLHLNRTS